MTQRIPLRWRLTLWYGLLLAFALIGAAVTLYVGLGWRLRTGFDQQLDEQAQVVAATIDPTGKVGSGDVRGDQEYLVRLVDSTGQTLLEEGYGSDQVAIDPNALAAALRGERSFSTLSIDPDVRLHLISVPIRSPQTGDITGMVQVGMDRADLDETLRTLLTGLLVVVPVALAIAVGGGYVLAGRALQPLSTITSMAHRMSEHDLHQRLNLDLPNDELGRLATTLDGMLGRIELAFERQRRFTSDAAHELRTPLSLMRSQIDVALSQYHNPEQFRGAMRGLDNDLMRVTGLTSALLSIARLEQANTPLERDIFDLATLIGDITDQYETVMADAGIALRVESVPQMVSADADMVIQVLVNLLDNARDHTPIDGTITVANGQDASMPWVTVTDTGYGVPEEDQPRIFDRFYRPDTGRTRSRGGAGLGLAICKAIIDAHNGTITFTSQPGAGTTVRFTLPLAIPDPSSQIQVQPST